MKGGLEYEFVEWRQIVPMSSDWEYEMGGGRQIVPWGDSEQHQLDKRAKSSSTVPK